jgi:ubiquinone/menaquinone biosynthesis C-methylase UbiE
LNSPHTLPTTARAPRASVHRVDPAQGKTTSHGDHTLLPFLYAMDQEHGWSQGMRAITHVLLAATGQKRGPLLELGCGSGVFLQEVIEHDPHQMGIGIDRSSIALEHADQRHAPLQLAQADLQQLPFAANHFGLIVALDSFDQRAIDLSVALQESWRILQPHGLLLLRVSAHPWLHGAHDAAFNTGRRYQRQELLTALHANAFQVERVTYANSLLALPVILQRFLQRWHLLSFAGHDTLSPVIHQQVARLLRWEANLLRTINLPFGISLYVLARKRP